MRKFYVFWFFFCAGWGFGMSGFPESDALPWGQLAASFPIGVLSFVVMLWFELRQLPPGRFADQPSLSLKPWNRPTGMLLFGGLSFVFASLWGVAIAVVADLPGLRVALQFLSLGASVVAAIFVCRYAFPSKFRV